jgi:NAD(P)H-flavin reductase
VGIRGPYGRGWDVDDGRGGDVVLVAGGIGLAPLRPALLQILARRDEYKRVVLLYGTRTPEDVLYADELERWRGRFDLEVDVTVDYGPPGWRGKVGLVTSLIPRAGFDPATTLALVCGPEAMMRYVGSALVERGVAKNRIRLSMERAMDCGVGLCGHCQLRSLFVCVDGPVFGYDRLEPLLWLREV